MKNKSYNKVYFICVSGLIAALYVVLTSISALFGMSSGVIQVRLSEALCVLPVFTSAAIPGLTVGCLISNILFSGNVFDIVFGTLATLIGALGAYWLRKYKWTVTLPTVIANALIIPFVIAYGYGSTEASIPFMMLTVGLGELISATALGSALLLTLKKYNVKI